jgi:hypothetical protein
MAIDVIETRASQSAAQPVIGYGMRTMIEATPVLTVAGTYSAGDYVGVSGTAMAFASCARFSAGSGKIESAVLIDDGAQAGTVELWLFSSIVVPPADNAAWTITDAESEKFIGVVTFDTFYAGSASVSQVHNLNIPFKAATGATSLYGCFVTRGAPVYIDGDLTLRLLISQD